jgi:hypothetical protein
LCLNHTAGYTPISRFTIVRDSTSLKEIFHKIRAHYGIAISGTSILDALSFTKSSDESAEDLYQRILGLVDSCLLTPESEITHHDTSVVIDPHIQSDWLQPSLNHCVDGRVRLTNTSCLPITISKDQIIASACVVEENTPIDVS